MKQWVVRGGNSTAIFCNGYALVSHNQPYKFLCLTRHQSAVTVLWILQLTAKYCGIATDTHNKPYQLFNFIIFLSKSFLKISKIWAEIMRNGLSTWLLLPHHWQLIDFPAG